MKLRLFRGVSYFWQIVDINRLKKQILFLLKAKVFFMKMLMRKCWVNNHIRDAINFN